MEEFFFEGGQFFWRKIAFQRFIPQVDDFWFDEFTMSTTRRLSFQIVETFLQITMFVAQFIGVCQIFLVVIFQLIVG